MTEFDPIADKLIESKTALAFYEDSQIARYMQAETLLAIARQKLKNIGLSDRSKILGIPVSQNPNILQPEAANG